MEKVLWIVFFLFWALWADAQIACMPEAYSHSEWSYSIRDLETPEDFEGDSLHIHFSEPNEQGETYVYIINRTDDVVPSPRSGIIQEAKNEEGEWAPIEYKGEYSALHPKGWGGCGVGSIIPKEDSLFSNQYVMCTKPYYNEGGFCTEIRFKYSVGDKDYYSESYEGCVPTCQFVPMVGLSCGSVLRDIFNFSPKVQMTWMRSQLAVPGLSEREKEWLTYKMAHSLSKEKRFGEAWQFLDNALEINPENGRIFMTRGMLYAKSARHCYEGDRNMQRIFVLLAIDEWKKAAKMDFRLRQQAEEYIEKYLPHTDFDEDFHPLVGGKRPEKLYIGCWLDREVRIPWLD